MANLNTLYCSECGSSDVQIQAWVDANTHEYESSVNNPLEIQDCWCNDCEDHVNWQRFQNCGSSLVTFL